MGLSLKKPVSALLTFLSNWRLNIALTGSNSLFWTFTVLDWRCFCLSNFLRIYLCLILSDLNLNFSEPQSCSSHCWLKSAGLAFWSSASYDYLRISNWGWSFLEKSSSLGLDALDSAWDSILLPFPLPDLDLVSWSEPSLNSWNSLHSPYSGQFCLLASAEYLRPPSLRSNTRISSIMLWT